MDQELNFAVPQDNDAIESVDDAEVAAIEAEAERETMRIQEDLAEVDRRLELEYATLGKRAYEYAQTDSEIASRLGVALAAVTAQNEKRTQLLRSLEAVEKKMADRLADARHARETEEASRQIDEELASKEEAAREAIQRAEQLQREAEEARAARESAHREAEAALLAASQTLPMTFLGGEPKEKPEVNIPVIDMSAADSANSLEALVESFRDADEREASSPVEPGSVFEPATPWALGGEGASEPEEEPEDSGDGVAPAADGGFAEPAELDEVVSDEMPIALPCDEAADAETEGDAPIGPTAEEGGFSWSATPWNERPSSEDGEDVEADAEAEVEADAEAEVEAEFAAEPEVAAVDDIDVTFPEEPEEPIEGDWLNIDPDDGDAFATESETSWTPSPWTIPSIVQEDEDAAASASLTDDSRQNAGTTNDLDASFGLSTAFDPLQTMRYTDESPLPQGAEGSGVLNTLNFNDDAVPSASVIRTCPACGFEVSEGDSFCLKCGTKLEAAQQVASGALAGLRPDQFMSESGASDSAASLGAGGFAGEPMPITCRVCGGQMQQGDRFCMRCGTPNDQIPSIGGFAPAPAAPAACAACKAPLNPGDKFCMVCGAPVQQVPSQQAPATVMARLCPNCGSEYAESDKFCMTCGHKL